MVPGIVGFLIGGADNPGFHLYNIGVDGSVTEESKFTSDGSGSVFAYGVLETLYTDDLSLDQAKELALKSLNAAMQRDSASGSGIDVVVITHAGAERVLTREVNIEKF